MLFTQISFVVDALKRKKRKKKEEKEEERNRFLFLNVVAPSLLSVELSRSISNLI